MSYEYDKVILCLANSRKLSGRCIAGKELIQDQIGEWIRPVSAREHEEISEEDRRYDDGRSAGLLDIISIPMIEPRPKLYQSENHLIDDKYYWEYRGKATWDDIVRATDNVDRPLFVNGHSTFNGFNDTVPQDFSVTCHQSLFLINPSGLCITVGREGGVYSPAKRRVRASFSLNGEHYIISVTDPRIERQYLGGPDGTFSIAESRLCISLGELFKGAAYKLVASIITPERVEQQS